MHRAQITDVSRMICNSLSLLRGLLALGFHLPNEVLKRANSNLDFGSSYFFKEKNYIISKVVAESFNALKNTVISTLHNKCKNFYAKLLTI